MSSQESGSKCELEGQISCPLIRVLRALGGKWALPIMYGLSTADQPQRFCQLHKQLAPITQTELSRQLREFERLGLVVRTVYAEVPARVEYEASPLGASLRQPLEAMAQWTIAHEHELAGRLDSQED